MQLHKIFTMVALLLTLSASAAVSSRFYDVDGLRYSVNAETKEATLVANQYTLSDVAVPSSITVDGTAYQVTALGPLCFKGCTGLVSVTIPSSVKKLGNLCFYNCTSLESITIPDAVTMLGDGCFQGCTGLASVSLGKAVTTLGEFCFNGCTSLESITLPDAVTTLGDYCFAECTSLKSVSMTGKVNVSRTSFYKCPNLM